MVLTSAGRYLRETLTNIIYIFSWRPFYLRHFLWHINDPKYIDPSVLMTRFFYKVSGAHLGNLRRRQEGHALVGQGFPCQCAHHWWCANHQHRTPRMDTGCLQPSPGQELLRLWPAHRGATNSFCYPCSHPPSLEANLHLYLQRIIQSCSRKWKT